MKVEAYLEKVEKGRDVVLYGISVYGLEKYRQLKEAGVEASFYFCKTGEQADQPADLDIKVLSLHELYAMDREKTVVFVYSDEEPIEEKRERLELAGFQDIRCCMPGLEKIYGVFSLIPDMRQELKELFYEFFFEVYEYRPRAELKRGHDRILILKKVIEISKAYNLLEDEQSRLTFRNVLRYRITGRNQYLTECAVYPQYFMEGIYEFGEGEVYVDAGAAQGDSILNFIRHVNGKYEKIYAFEAKKSYRTGMKELFENEKVEIIPRGLHEKTGKLYFVDNQHGSMLSEQGGSSEIEVTSLDDTITGKVSFIKMDIEGSEIPALRGGERVIRENKPKLAVCVYHLEEDLWEIPLLIKQLAPEYKIYMRQHFEELDWETVCYAAL